MVRSPDEGKLTESAGLGSQGPSKHAIAINSVRVHRDSTHSSFNTADFTKNSVALSGASPRSEGAKLGSLEKKVRGQERQLQVLSNALSASIQLVMKQQEQLGRLKAKETGSSAELLTKSTVAPWEVVRDFIDSLGNSARGEERAEALARALAPLAEEETGLQKRDRRAGENKRYVSKAAPNAIGKTLLDTSMSPIKRENPRDDLEESKRVPVDTAELRRTPKEKREPEVREHSVEEAKSYPATLFQRRQPPQTLTAVPTEEPAKAVELAVEDYEEGGGQLREEGKEEERRVFNSITAENLTLRNDEVFIPLDTSSFVVGGREEEEFEESEGGRVTPGGVFGAYYGPAREEPASFERVIASKGGSSGLDLSNRTPSVNLNDESAMNMCTEFSKHHRRNETESELNCTALGARGKESLVEAEEDEEKKAEAHARRVTDSYSPVILNNLLVNVSAVGVNCCV